MVEGPGVHRVAIAHRRLLLAKAFVATSPCGRFADGAAAINGCYLSLIEAHGKNVFYFFTKNKIDNATLNGLPPDVIVVHIHFGMSGSFRTFSFPGPDPREKTRLRLVNEKEKIVAHLSASVCVHGGLDLYRERIAVLGPDPLRDDADKELVWTKMRKSKKTIGGIIMDQSFIAGIGNIYRTEILFVIGLHPDQPVSSVSRSTFEELWNHSVRLLRVGVVAGSIITVSPEEAGKPYSKLKSGERRYVYSHETCKRCGGPVRSWTCAARTVYACEICQPLKTLLVEEVITSGGDALPAKVDRASMKKSHSLSISEKAVKLKESKLTSSTISFRKRKIRDGRIVEHQALKDIPTGGLVDFPSSLDDLTWPMVNPQVIEKSRALSKVDRTPMSIVLPLADIKPPGVEEESQRGHQRTVDPKNPKNPKNRKNPKTPENPKVIEKAGARSKVVVISRVLESPLVNVKPPGGQQGGGRRSSRVSKRVVRLGVDV